MADSLKSTIEKLAVGASDLIVLHVHEDDDEIGIGGKLRKALTRNGVNNTIIVCRDGTSVSSLDPETMALHGWYRKATIKTAQ